MAITKQIAIGSDVFTFATKTSELTNNSGFITDSNVGNGKITVFQGGEEKGAFKVNQSDDLEIHLDAGSTEGNYVAYDTPQELTDEQRDQARENIGAGTSNFSGNYNDLTNKPTIPSTTQNMVFTLADGTTKTIRIYTA